MVEGIATALADRVVQALALLLLLGGLRAFERASVTSIKPLLAWIAALAGLSLTFLLVLTGRGPLAFFALSLLFPLIRERWLARWRRVGAGMPLRGPPPGVRAGRSAWRRRMKCLA